MVDHLRGPAAMRIHHGAPISAHGENGLGISPFAARMVGIARRSAVRPDPFYEEGDPVDVQTEGGILAVFNEPMDVEIDGVVVRLFDKVYVYLTKGKITSCRV